MKNLLLSAALAAATMSFAPPPVQAQQITICEEITALPATISAAGVYCLKRNLGTNITNGNAITINANNVTFNMNGYRLGGATAGPSTEAIGIFAEGRRNIIISNGTIRGFQTGIGIIEESGGATPSSGHVIKDMLIDNVTAIGINISGTGLTIRNNSIVNIDTTQPASMNGFSPAPVKAQTSTTTGRTGGELASQLGTGSNALGIRAVGISNSLIENNFISNLTSPIAAFGISLGNAENVNVTGNTVQKIVGSTFANPILADSGFVNRLVFQNNTLVDGQASITEGIFIDGTNIGCFNNTIIGFATAQTAGCTWENGTFPVLP